MANFLKSKSAWMLGLGLLLGVGIVIGVLVATGGNPSGTFALPETALHAAGASRTETMAVATGPIDEDTEGLFILDFQTGELMCFVIYQKGAGKRKIGGFFRTNVIKDLGFEKQKKPNYLLVTGETNFLRGGGVLRPGISVAYVVDVNTGKFAAYVVPWDQTAHARMVPQTAQLITLDGETIRRKAPQPRK